MFKSALRAEMEARLASLDDFCNSNTVDAAFVEATQALVRPWPTVADFLRRLADDLDAKRATTVGRDETFERLRIMGPGYDLFIGRYDPERHRM